MADNQISELITVAEAASRIGVPRTRFAQWVSWGTLSDEQGVRRLGRNIRIDWPLFESAFEAWKAAHPAALHSDGVSLSMRNAAARRVRVASRNFPALEPKDAKGKGNRVEPTSSTEHATQREGMAAPAPEFVTVQEAARRLSINPFTIYNWISAGRVNARHGVRHVGRLVRIDWEVLATAVRKGRL